VESGDAFEADDPPPFRPPPPPDDRLWRHPSELAWSSPPAPRRAGWPLAAAAGVVGAVVTVALLAVTGVIGDDAPGRDVVIRETVQPAVARSVDDGWDLAAMVAEVGPAIVRLDVSGGDAGVGSGVVFRSDGHLLTNAHVVDDADRIVAVLSTGRSVQARLVGFDRRTDIAVVKLDEDGPFATAVLGTTDGLVVGQTAIAMGSPLGLRGGSSVTVGIISALGREIESPDGPVLYDMVQTDAAITSGSSGGALLDGTGSVVGITTAFAVGDLGNGGLGFATPIDVARAVADDLLTYGRARRVWFGVRGSTDAAAAGVVLAEVVDDGPASESGLRAGDVIRRVDGRPVPTMSALRVALLRHHPGDLVGVVYDRDGKRRSAQVTLRERPDS